MMPRFITKSEEKYDAMFPDSEATCYFFESDDNRWEQKLTEAIERGTPLTHEEIVVLHGSEEKLQQFITYTAQWDGACSSK